MFLHLCGIPGGLASQHASQVTSPGGQGVCLGGGGLPPGGLHPGGLGRPTPWDNTEYGQQAGGTHPTGMNSRNTLVWR